MVDMNQYLTSLSQKLILDPTKKSRIELSLNHLIKSLWGHFQDRLSSVEVIGSFDRDTIISEDPDSDVDTIVVFKQKEVKPDTYLSQLKDFCKAIYPRSEIYQDYPTIVIDMEHVKFEIVPSYFVTDSVKKIPAPRAKEFSWINTSPKDFKNSVDSKDRNNKNFIKPLIRIFKYWNFLNDKAFSSYEIERLLISKSYTCTTLKDYFVSGINALTENASTDAQKKVCTALRERRRRLRALEEVKIPEYIETELQAFLPLPK